MLNISLCFNRKDFEYDVYSLIKAFYPGCEITSWYEEDGALDGEFAYYDTITYEADQICFRLQTRNMRRSLRSVRRWNMKKTAMKRKMS